MFTYGSVGSQSRDRGADSGQDTCARVCAITMCVLATLCVLFVLVYLIVHFASASGDGHGVDECEEAVRPQAIALTSERKARGVQEVTRAEDIDAVVAHKPAVVMFHALWCGACRASMPHVQRLAPTSPVAVLALEHKHLSQAVAKKFGVTAFPTFVKLEQKTGNVLGVVRGGNMPAVKKLLEIGGQE